LRTTAFFFATGTFFFVTTGFLVATGFFVAITFFLTTGAFFAITLLAVGLGVGFVVAAKDVGALKH